MKTIVASLVVLVSLLLAHGHSVALAQVHPIRDFSPVGTRDIDDSALWVHPTDPSLSTIILSDKRARRIYVVRLDGTVLQTVTTASSGYGPGNIDIRHAVRLGDETLDVVVSANRETGRLDVYRVDQADGTLVQIDDGAIHVTHARPVYGLGLYHSPISGKLFAIVTQNGHGRLEQIELVASGNQVSGVQVRAWDVGGLTEGVVVDDENQRLLYAEENVGVWSTSAEPDGDRPGSPVAGMQVGENDLSDDLEGLALYHHSDGGGYLLVSSQGSDSYGVFERVPPHNHVGTFSLSGVSKTDGIDVTPVALGSALTEGAMTAHDGTSSPHTTVLVSWADIRAALPAIVAAPAPTWHPRIHLEGDGDGDADAGRGVGGDDEASEEPGGKDGGAAQPPRASVDRDGCSTVSGPAAPVSAGALLILIVYLRTRISRRCSSSGSSDS